MKKRKQQDGRHITVNHDKGTAKIKEVIKGHVLLTAKGTFEPNDESAPIDWNVEDIRRQCEDIQKQFEI